VFHPAWGYLAAGLGLEQVAVEQEGKEPSPAELAALVDRARADRVRVVFVQPQGSPDAALVFAREVGARVEVIDPLARDWPDNLRRVAEALAGALRP
jgi:zinc transport system substrate-binding protein